MFDNFKKGINSVFDKFFSRKISESEFEEAMREFRLVLLDADINLHTVRKLINSIKDQCIGQEIAKNSSPKQLITKIIYDELVKLVTSDDQELNLNKKQNIILMTGLQGSGKTTTCGKLANFLKKKGKKVLLVSLDTYRPAAQEQLEILAKNAGVDSLEIIKNQNPYEICKRGLSDKSYDVIIFDSAGRISLDLNMMDELEKIKEIINPNEILLVIDGLMGQSASDLAKSFNDKISITGTILTKIDSDAKGGAIISVKDYINKPVKFLCSGEKLGDIEIFHPDRIISRIMDMGDIESLAEKMKDSIDEKEAEKISNKIFKGQFGLTDYFNLAKSIKKFGGIFSILSFLPGNNKLMENLGSSKVNDKDFEIDMVIFQSMTKKERKNPKILDNSRKIRISKGSGTSLERVNDLLKRYFQIEKTIKQLFGGNSSLSSMFKNLL